MAMNENYYNKPGSRPLSTSQLVPSPFTSSPAPPPPPPKSGSQDTSGQGTPQIPPSPLSPAAYDRPPPLPKDTADTHRPVPPIPSVASRPVDQLQTNESKSDFPSLKPPRLPSPFLPDSLPAKSKAELAPIFSDPSLLSALASTHTAHAEAIVPVHRALEINLALAAQLKTLENHLNSVREQTQQLLLQHTTLSTQWKRKQIEMDQALEPWSPKAMYARLVSGISEQEAIVHAVEESFLEAGDTVDYTHHGTAGKASEREVGEWIKRIREGVAVLERRKQSKARWDEGRVGGWR